MKKFFITLCISLLLIGAIRTHPLCVNGDGPSKPETPLDLCTDYNDAGCCTIDTEATIKSELANSGVPDGQCRVLLQQILCSRCDSWAAHLFDAESGNGVREAPFLCNDYCGQVWSACQNVVITGNPFDDQKRAISLNELYSSQAAFCAAYKTNSGQYCYSGAPFVPTVITDKNFTETVCVERILDTKTYLVMAVTPVEKDNRLFLGTQKGTIDIYDKDSQAITGTFLDISGKTFINGETGMHGLTFHPDFETNGLFYVVYSCPPSNANCQWKCDRGCPYGNCKADGYCENLSHIQILEEYKVDGAWSANKAVPTAVRRILEYPHPYANHNGGDLHFGPEDGYLYTTTGDGGYQDDPFYSAQNLKSILGKVLRIDVNNKQNGKEYAIPSDNPFVNNNDALGEIWAYGLRNPFRFSFDKVTGKLWVGDVGGAVVEEIDIITKGANYGWSRYEGNEVHRTDKPDIPNRVGPTMAYYRTFIDPACVIGGYVYRASMNPCLSGTYLFADYFGVLMQGKEVADGSDIWNMYKVSTKCASTSPKACRTLDIVFSFGQDRNNDMYILAKDAVFKIVDSSKCGLTCNALVSSPPPPSTPVSTTPIANLAPTASTPIVSTPPKPVAPPIVETPVTVITPVATPESVNNQVTSSGSVLFNAFVFVIIAIASVLIH